MSELVFIEETPMEGYSRPAVPGTTIGRAGCDVDLTDPDVSRRHAVVRALDGGLAVEDLGSTNGTFIGRERLTDARPVEIGTTLRIGKTVLELRG
jgi:pSer/pThr/pTyr-binding forkhead associated (FHA) protein